MNSVIQQRVLENLITMYKDKGVSFEKLLDNPIFVRMPIEQKISVIKQMGSKVGPGNGAKWDIEDAKKLLLGLGIGTLAFAMGKGMAANWAANAALPTTTKLVAFAPQAIGVMGATTAALTKLDEFHRNYENKKRLYNMNTNNDNEIINYLTRM